MLQTDSDFGNSFICYKELLLSVSTNASSFKAVHVHNNKTPALLSARSVGHLHVICPDILFNRFI